MALLGEMKMKRNSHRSVSAAAGRNWLAHRKPNGSAPRGVVIAEWILFKTFFMVNIKDAEKYFNKYIKDEDGQDTDVENPDYQDCDLLNKVGDNAMEGLKLICNQLNKAGKANRTVVCGVEHDVIYSISMDDALEILSEEDFKQLARLNWMIENDSLACFV